MHLLDNHPHPAQVCLTAGLNTSYEVCFAYKALMSTHMTCATMDSARMCMGSSCRCGRDARGLERDVPFAGTNATGRGTNRSTLSGGSYRMSHLYRSCRLREIAGGFHMYK